MSLRSWRTVSPLVARSRAVAPTRPVRTARSFARAGTAPPGPGAGLHPRADPAGSGNGGLLGLPAHLVGVGGEEPPVRDQLLEPLLEASDVVLVVPVELLQGLLGQGLLDADDAE